MRRALLLIAHGSRRQEANADLYYFADEIRRRGAFDIVECSFLEMAQPDVLTGVCACLRQGAGQVILLPFFLSPGKHVCEDLQRLCQDLARHHPERSFVLAAPLGRDPLLVDVILRRASEAAQRLSSSEPLSADACPAAFPGTQAGAGD
ncbi:MAG: cobalamin biosynthesis protein CbiX [Gemmataceae bacterium]